MSAAGFIVQGVKAHGAGRLDEAESLFRLALKADPDALMALELLGLLRFEAGDAAEAERLLERAAGLDVRRALPLKALARVRAAADDLEGAARAYREAAEREPADAALSLALAQTELALGRHEAALEAARKSCAAPALRAEAELAAGGALFGLGRAGEAARAYERALSLNPALAAAQIGRALALLAEKNAEAAAQSAAAALAIDPAAPLAWCVLGMARHALCAFWPAAEALEEAARLDPFLAVAQRYLGIVYFDLERLAFAETHFLKALELNPRDAGVHASLSSLYCREDRLEEGRRHALLALEIDPGERTAHENLARLFAREGRGDEARRHREAAFAERGFHVAGVAPGRTNVLVLVAADTGNTPDRFLLPLDRYGRIYWVLEYAQEGDLHALPPYDLVFNAIGDPDEAPRAAKAMEAFLKRNHKPVLNRPDAVARTARDGAPALLAGIEGLLVPKVARLAAADLSRKGLRAAARRAGIETPFIARPLGSHGGVGLTLVEDEAGAARRLAEAPGQDLYVTAFHDFRDGDGLYRKYRMFFVDREPYPYHLAVGERWLLHYESSGARAHPARLDEERRFLDDPEAALGPAALAAVREVGKRLDLDFAGMDFALAPNGQALLFEANATMLAHPEPEGPTFHKNPSVERIFTAFRDMLARRLSAPA